MIHEHIFKEFDRQIWFYCPTCNGNISAYVFATILGHEDDGRVLVSNGYCMWCNTPIPPLDGLLK